jgi:hypothetical protein
VAPPIFDRHQASYWRTASPAERIVYFWLTGEDPPTYKPAHQQRRRPHRKDSRRRISESQQQLPVA